MKNMLPLLSLLAVAFTFGCKPSGEKALNQSPDTANQKLDQARTSAKESALQLRDYAYEQKAEFIAAMKSELAILNQNIDELSLKLEKAGEAAQAEAKPKLAALREQSEKLSKQLGAAETATASTWSSIKVDSEKACVALKDGVAKSRQWLSEKIAP